ncbi:MAG: signal peptide peptidase SppA [Alphaproteobacteria bacterium]
MRKDPWQRRKTLFSPPVSKTAEKPKVKWRLLPILWLALKRTCTFMGALVLLVSFFILMSISSVIDEIEPELPDQMVLYINLDGKLGEVSENAGLIDPFSEQIRTVKSFTDALERAKNDARVEGVYAYLSVGGYALAHVQEIRIAVKDFRSSGKFAYIFAPSYSGGLGNYYLASAFDEIWMQPMGVVAIPGINAEMPFARQLLDTVGVEPNFFQRKEYKSAYESLTNSTISDANKEAIQKLIDDLSSVLISEIAKDNRLKDGRSLTELVDHGIFLDNEALESGLVDHVDYADHLVELINEKVTGDSKSEDLAYIHFDRYVADMRDQKQSLTNSLMKQEDVEEKKNPRVALVYAVGAIVETTGDGSPSGYASADKIAGTLLGIADDDLIDGVVLRVDSPGGSPIASETILRAVEKVQEEEKFVIVSMGPTAASGGYWISAYADRIFVLPTTITGSIGVLGGKFSAASLWEKLGVNWDSVQWGENSAIWSMTKPFSDSEAVRINAMLDHIYDGFLKRVAQGREMSIEDVDRIARGRVWSGVSAVDIGIADQLGGLNDALDYAAVKSGAADRHDIDVIILPRPLTPIEQFIEIFEGQVMAGQVISTYAPYLEPFISSLPDLNVLSTPTKNSVYQPPIYVE